jgi:hypothetical protein
VDKDVLKDALEQFQLIVDAEQENRELALEDKQFAKLGGKYQWPDKIWQDRFDESRPCLTINRMPQFLKQVINDQRMNKPSITVRPVDNQGDRLTARIFQGLIRNIEVSSNADRAYDMSFDDAVTMGFGYFRIVTEYAHDSTFEQDIKIKGVENAFTVYLDPDDLFEPKFGFITDMVKRSVFKAKYGFEPKPVPSGGLGESLQGWYDKDAVRVAEYWRVHTRPRKLLLVTDAIGDQARAVYEDEFNPQLAQQMGMKVARDRMVECPYVEQYIMTGQEFGGDPTPWAGKWIPIIPVLGEAINVEGKRHLQGLIRHAKDPQRNFNYWRTVATETVALAPLAPWVGAKGQFESDNDKWATANRKPHAFLQYDPVIDEATGEPIPVPPPQRQAMAGIPAGALQEAANASDDMKSVMGLYDASLGARSNETSGVAIQTRQREGDVSTFNFMDGFARDSLTHAGRILIDLIPKVYDTARVVRIIGSDDQPELVQINQMFMGPDGKPRNFDLSTGKYDVVVKVGPSFTTQREEVRSSMLDFIKMYPPAAPILGPFIAKNMDWPDSEKVSKMLQSLLPPPAQGQDPQREQMMQHIQQLTQQIGALEQDKSLETRKIDNDAYNAETNRLEAIAKVAPQALQQMVMPLVVQAVHDIMNSPDILMGAQPQGPVPMGPGAPPVDPGAMPPQQVPPQAPPGAFSPPA